MIRADGEPRRRGRRIRWRKVALVLTLGYFGFWSGDSLWHLWRLWQMEQQVTRQIAAVQAETQQLQQDIHLMQNPQKLKPMLAGQRPFPAVAGLEAPASPVGP
ncbi:MAG: hypothetical protein K6U14_06140 [Firmicutes bacterium]|nr:hypothetical protein [Alicyclobacillaceae bacterium]MCL6497199.1 hypothetical protein [Bacillota bacterium]